MILADAEPNGWVVLGMAAAALTTQLGAVIVKRVRSGDAPPPVTLEAQLMEEWQEIAQESRLELGECRRERQRQDEVIAGQGKLIDQLGGRVRKLEDELRDIATEVHQWRNGQRVPAGYILSPAPPAPPQPRGGT